MMDKYSWDGMLNQIDKLEKQLQACEERNQQLLSDKQRLEKINNELRLALNEPANVLAQRVINLQSANYELRRELDEARSQRDWLIKECERIGVTVNVLVGQPLERCYQLVNERIAKLEAELQEYTDGDWRTWKQEFEKVQCELDEANQRIKRLMNDPNYLALSTLQDRIAKLEAELQIEKGWVKQYREGYCKLVEARRKIKKLNEAWIRTLRNCDCPKC